MSIELIARPELRERLDAWLEESGTLYDAAAGRSGGRTVRGRTRVHIVPAPEGPGEWAVRHYRRGGAIARLFGDRYLRLGAPRPFREYRVGRRLEELGLPTVTHLAAAVYRSGPWYRGDLVTGYVPGSRDLAEVLFPTDRPSGRDEAVGALRAAGLLIRSLHSHGVVHPDLNLKNILIVGADSDRTGPDAAARGAGDPAYEALVLDLDRVEIRPWVRERVRRRMIDRFWRSARKWEEKTGRELGPDERAAFEQGYESDFEFSTGPDPS